jgi:hypothetical protein
MASELLPRAGSVNSDRLFSGNSGRSGCPLRLTYSLHQAAGEGMIDMLTRHAIQVLR